MKIFAVLSDTDVTRKLLEAILDSPGGRRSLSRMARTCRTFCEPALNLLWRELDSFAPLAGLFPNLMRKAHKPSWGLVKAPGKDDWEVFNRYHERVRRITYDERTSAIVASIFPMLDENKPREFILPFLEELTWKVQTPAGLTHCEMFLNPGLQALHLEVAVRLPQLDDFLQMMSNHTRLTTFSFNSPTTLPDSFTDLLHNQNTLEKVILVAPGALSPSVGRWLASLEHLTHLQLDLSGRSMIAVEGFFDELFSRSGYSTPSSMTSSDVDDELDFSEIRKSTLRLTGDLSPRRIFHQLRKLQLTGEVSNIAVFLKHITSPLVHMDFVIEDPPDRADWQDLCALICERFQETLSSLRIIATSSSRFADLIRTTQRGEPASNRLGLEYLTSLPNLLRLEIDLPESVIFTSADLACLAQSSPKLESLRLCPLAKFPSAIGPPQISLDDLAVLLRTCRNLQTVSGVFNARPVSEEILTTQQVSSDSLLRLNVGHSWISDSLQVAISISHLAPRLETVKWFQEKTRSGYVEVNAKHWQTLSELLPHLQKVRLAERGFSKTAVPVVLRPTAIPPKKVDKVDKCVGMTFVYVDRSVDAQPFTVNTSVQAAPLLTDRKIEAIPLTFSVTVDATPIVSCASIDATASVLDQGVDTTDAPNFEDPIPTPAPPDHEMPVVSPQAYALSYIYYLLSFFHQILAILPFAMPARILYLMEGYYKRWSQGLKRERSHPELRQERSQNGLTPEAAHAIKGDDALETVQDVQKYRDDTYDVHELMIQHGNKPMETESSNVKETVWLRECQIRINNTATRHLRQTPSIMADNKKQEKDFTKEVDELLQQVDPIAKLGQLQDALNRLFALEKQTRNAADLASTSRLVKAIVQYSYDARDYPGLNSNVALLSKKHGQLKGAIQAMVELVLGWLEEVKQRDGVEKWLELVETLRSVTEGKIFLETPRARVTLSLATYHEGLVTSATTAAAAKDSLQTASDLLSDLQVETYSSMERREKTEFILEQMRLLIALARFKDAESGKEGKDLGGGEAEWVKARVGGRKVNEDFLKQEENEDLKLKYYDLMIQHALHYNSYLDVAKYYYKVWETPSIKSDVNDKGKAALEHIVYYVVLAPHNNEQSDMLHHLFVDPALARLELHCNLTKCFVTRELMRWPGIEAIYGQFLRQTNVFSQDKRWEDLHTRVIEHNIRVVAEYYTRITLSRLTTLLDLSPKQTEETLCRLVVSGTVWARIDRPAGIVNFRAKRSAEDVMNDWSSDMQKLLGLVEKTWMGMNAALAAQSRVKAT
ncbi:hypothetical protein APHAL10511_006071 [Amanita phalloides]|nr:hypothetical protein APHAL10511_006071 [Amanita phalloides]